PIGCVYLRTQKDGYVSTDLNPQGLHDNIKITLQRLRVVSGRIVEIEGSPLNGVTAEAPFHTTLTNPAGQFVLAGVGDYFNVRKEGWVGRTVTLPHGQDLDLGDVRLQRMLSLSVKSSVTTRLSPDDVDYTFDDDLDVVPWCSPCKWIDVVTRGQDLDIRLQWSGEVPMSIWATSDFWGTSVSATPKPGESALTLRVPAATRAVLVGVLNPRRTPLLLQPEPFDISASPQP